MSNSAATYGSPFVLKARDWTVGILLMMGAVIASFIASLALLSQLPSELRVITSIAVPGVAAVGVFSLYLVTANRSFSYVDVPDFSVRAVGLGVLFGLVLTTIQAGLTLLFLFLGIGESVGSVGKMVQARGIHFLLLLIVVNLIIIAPAEELLYRNGVQKAFYRSHSTMLAVVSSAVIFTLPHSLNLWGASQAELVSGLLEVFVNGVGYGAAYAYWKRLDITIVAHGIYNCAVFGFAYFHVFGP